MPVYLSTSQPSSVYLGTSSVTAIYLGSSQVFSSTPVITITSQPTNVTNGPSETSYSVTATVTNAATVTYQWQRQAQAAGAFADISGATSSTLLLTGLSVLYNDGDYYRCVLSATGAASVTSNAAFLAWPPNTRILIARDNGAGSTTSFSGIGTQSQPYARSAGYYFDDTQGMLHYTFTLTTSGTVYMTCTCVDENDSGQTFAFKKNGTAFATSLNGGSNGFSGNVAGVAGDVFTIVANANSGAWSSQMIDTVSVYAT